MSKLIVLLFLVMTAGCSLHGTSTGNPVVALTFDPYNSAASTKVSEAVSAQAISSVKFCFKRLRFKQAGSSTNPDPTLDSDNIDFQLGEISVSDLGTILGAITLPVGTYVRVEFDLENHCASGQSIQLTNSNGSFSTNERITIKFNGVFNHAADEPLALNVQPITSALNTVSAANQIRTKAETASGTY